VIDAPACPRCWRAFGPRRLWRHLSLPLLHAGWYGMSNVVSCPTSLRPS
jgi:hypothetical protein